jgi:DNA-binding NtrC family response regulator
VWLTGEPGSGKETAARVAHHAGPRRNAAFVALDCVGLQPYLIDSLLFGRGSLLSAEHAGTVYLKEPAALPRDMQQRFADFFTEPKPGAPRLICGSVRTAAEDAAGGMLVPEFHASLSVLELTVPPLRERLADLPRFASHFLPGTAIDPAAFQILAGQKWPGNLRELAAVLAEAAEAANRGTVKAEHLPREVRVRAGIDPPQPQPKPMTLDAILEAVEAKVIRLALARAGGNAAVAAEMLDIGRVRVLRQLKTKTIRKPKGQA